jgi:hypothetical protein
MVFDASPRHRDASKRRSRPRWRCFTSASRPIRCRSGASRTRQIVLNSPILSQRKLRQILAAQAGLDSIAVRRGAGVRPSARVHRALERAV